MPRLLSDGTLSEEDIHKTIMEWVRCHPLLKPYVLHFPNEGKRSLRYGKLMKDLGMRKGVADLLIAMPRHGFNGAWIELKSANGAIMSHQKKFMEDMHKQNYFTAYAWSIDQGIDLIRWYCLE